ncbi:MAG TPA: HEPN domain-containing protein [Ignavibacteria bacterium]|nr:HEPN domain-containing protein [Ignavibacteria bacterium]
MDDNTKEAEEYLKNAKDRLESAEILMNAGKYNDAISRVYYAFFDAATAALLSKNLTVKTHHGLIVLFEQNFIKTGKVNVGVGKWLARAKEAREEADYEIYKKFNKETVESGINAAKKFIKNIINIIK